MSTRTEAFDEAIAYCERHGIRYSLTAEEGARAMNGCSWTVKSFCQPDCTCARYYRQMMAQAEGDQAP